MHEENALSMELPGCFFENFTEDQIEISLLRT